MDCGKQIEYEMKITSLENQLYTELEQIKSATISDSRLYLFIWLLHFHILFICSLSLQYILRKRIQFFHLEYICS